MTVAKASKWLRPTVQVAVSIALIIYLAGMARHEHVAAAWSQAGPSTLLLACAIFAGATLFSVRRWQLLLRFQGIEEKLPRLIEVYYIGLFCGLFLPTAAGGDVFRVYDVSRRRGPVSRVLLATLQDRLVGLGAAMFIGLLGAMWFSAVLPGAVVAGAVAIYSMGLVVVTTALHQQFLVARLRPLIVSRRQPAIVQWILAWRMVYRVKSFLQPLRQARSLALRETLIVSLLALTTFSASVAMYLVVCGALGVSTNPLALCVAVSLVGIARMVPISPNGVGVGEGAFVAMMGFFGVSASQAAPVALTLLGVQIAMSLVGGLLLLLRMLGGSRLQAPAVRSSLSGVRFQATTFLSPDSGPRTPDNTINDVPVALLAGGMATRLGTITSALPKALVEVAGRPFIDHQLTLLRSHGIRRVVLCLGHFGEQIAAHVGDGSRFGLEVKYSFDGNKLLGTGGAVRQAVPMLGEAFWVMYGDSYMDIDYRTIWYAFKRQPALGLMTVIRNGNQWDRSNVVYQQGKLLCYDKRLPNAEMEHIDYGVSLFRRAALERIPENTCHDLADLMSDLVQRGQMTGFEVHNRFYEIGSPQGLEETSRHLQNAAVLAA